ncbi:YceI family protein [Viridibacterium curvum]|uniref:YceI family protein n=1 Tax=Viridibacterium curvum TaxID=1101404 RepID=A0ABP9QFP3_9RHOO
MHRIAIALALAGITAFAHGNADIYTIDPTHTAARFEYNHLNWTTQAHRFDQTIGKIQFDRAARTASVEVSIDARTVNTGYPVFNGHLQGEDFFDVARFPVITFKSTATRFDGDKLVAIDGDLTIKGITKPVSLTVTSFQAGPHPIQKKRESIGANAVARVKRSDFGMTKVPVVSDDIQLSFAVQAFKD